MLKKKILANFQRIIELFTQKIVTNSQKYGFGIRDPGSRGQKGTRSRIRIRNYAMHLTNEHSISGSVHQIRIPTSLPRRWVYEKLTNTKIVLVPVPNHAES